MLNQFINMYSDTQCLFLGVVQEFSETLGDPSCVFGSRSSFFSSTIPSCAASRINLRGSPSRCSSRNFKLREQNGEPGCSGCHQNMGNLKQLVTWMESIGIQFYMTCFHRATEMESNHVLAVSFYLASGFPSCREVSYTLTYTQYGSKLDIRK